MNSGSIKVGDLVTFSSNNPAFKEGYVLWAGPDYDDSSLDVKSVIRPGDVMLAILFVGENNVFLLLSDGTTGWCKPQVLEKV